MFVSKILCLLCLGLKRSRAERLIKFGGTLKLNSVPFFVLSNYKATINTTSMLDALCDLSIII